MFSATTKTGSQPSAAANYIEDVFSTYLYTGNDSTQTINNGIDLAGKGGLVWIKPRNLTEFHSLFDTTRGAGYYLSSSQTSAQSYGATTLTSFNSNGFSLGGATRVNGDPYNNVSWTFREQAKFFDVVTWTGAGSAMTINHNLGSVPGMIIMKKINGAPGTGNWAVWSRGLPTASGSQQYESNVFLNLTDTSDAYGYLTATPTSTSFSVSSSFGQSSDYVAYLFAHNAGGFGTTGTDNVISCGSFTTDSSGNATINLGYEPQYVLVKSSTANTGWWILDTMRGWSMVGGNGLFANTSGAEIVDTGTRFGNPTATGFIELANYGQTTGVQSYIYMAIRRPMKVPTSGTSVFLPSTFAGSSTTDQVINTGFTVDMTWGRIRDAAVSMEDYDRLRGNSKRLEINSTGAEATAAALYFDLSNSVSLRANFNLNYPGYNEVVYNFRRASGFMDVVCYSGNSTAGATQAHNLGVVPELMIVKTRNGAGENWAVYSAATGNNKYLVLNDTAGANTSTTRWNNTTPTASVFTLGTFSGVNFSTYTYVAYLFATCAGVSKVGTYTGNGTTQAISCGFTGGARFVLIKRTDAAGDWYVYDTARGMTTLTDPYLLTNSTAAEVATLGSVTTTTGGFSLNSTILADINVSSGTYIFLAIA